MKADLLRVLLHLKCSNYSRHVFFGEFFMSTPASVNKADKLSTIKVVCFITVLLCVYKTMALMTLAKSTNAPCVQA